MSCAQKFDAVESLIDALLLKTGPRIVLGIPLGIGKPNQFVNALYQRVQACPDLHLTIITALSLQKPHGNSELENRFLDPFVARVFGNYPDLDYLIAHREGRLPPNVRVVEQFFKTGDYLDNDLAQQNFLSVNYTNVARDLLTQGINVLAQAVAVDTDGDRLSLSSNPDILLDIQDLLATRPDLSVLIIACCNHSLPFMENQAVVNCDAFDMILNDPLSTHDLFAPPNMKVSLQDYAIGLYAGSLVPDGGTLQIGIGSLGDAITHGLLLRQKNNPHYRELMADLLGWPIPALVDLRPFQEGLYGCSEMFVNGFMHLIQAGIVRREVFDHYELQVLLNQKKLSVDLLPDTLSVLLEAGVISPVLTASDVVFLRHYGVFKPEVSFLQAQPQNQLQVADTLIPANLDSPAALALVSEHCLGARLSGGIFMHGGFFLGPRAFYQALRDVDSEVRKKIGMSRISFVNRLGDDARLQRVQRRDGRFINTTMTVTLLGAAGSESLASGRVVSGVGGQYNFVAMADSLLDGRSILMLRSTHSRQGETWSNIVWSYAQITIPRHLRDIVITEYGIADLQGQTDSECVKRMLAIADSRFQAELLAQAKQNGKLEADYQIPAAQCQNFPAQIEAKLRPWRERGCLPDFPLGTDFTEDELVIVRALRKLKEDIRHPVELVRMMLRGAYEADETSARYLARMQMSDADVEGIKLRLIRRLFLGNIA